MQLSDDDRAYFAHLQEQAEAAARAVDRRDAFLGYLARKYDLPNGSQVKDTGEVVLPPADEAAGA